MRAFIAIELDQAIHSQLAAIQAKLKPSDADVKWVAPENIHLTLKFLGDVKEAVLEKIKNALDIVASHTKPFTISLSDIGAFPNLNSPRVIWVGIKEGAIESTKLADDIEGKLADLGFAKENRPFSVHLTLGRIRSPKGRQQLKEAIETTNKSSSLISRLPRAESRGPSSFVANHITLFQSTLTPKGPIYTSLYEAKLRPI